MIKLEEINYNNQVSLLTYLHQREILDTPTQGFYVPLFSQYGKEIQQCHQVTYRLLPKPEYHMGTVETAYKALLRLHDMVFDVEAKHYWDLEQLESDSLVYKANR